MKSADAVAAGLKAARRIQGSVAACSIETEAQLDYTDEPQALYRIGDLPPELQDQLAPRCAGLS